MSLINDALKRTRQAQEQNLPPSAGPALRPVEPTNESSGRGARRLIYILVLCVVVGNALLFLALMDRGQKTPAPARTADAPPVAAATPVNPAPVQPAPISPPPAPAAPAASAEVTPPVETPAAPVEMSAVTGTNAPAPAAPAPAVVFENPKPAPLRLQSIIYNPTRPSAMIGGKFLFLGDRIQGFRLIAIDQETVTLVGHGQTNVLTLP